MVASNLSFHFGHKDLEPGFPFGNSQNLFPVETHKIKQTKRKAKNQKRMKLSNKIILSSLLSGLSCAVARLGENADPNASSLAVRGEAMTNVKCKLLVEEVDGDEKDGDEEEDEVNLICETMGEEDSFLFSLEGHNLPPTSDVESGRTVLLISDAILQPDTMSLHVPEEATVEFEPLPLVPQNRMLNSWTIGERTVLAVRVVAADKSSSYSEEGLSNKIFGTYGDKMTMSSQFEACSYGKLKFVPLEGTYNGVEINNGVVTVTLSNSVAGSNRHVFEYYTLEALKEIFGPWDSTTNTWIADHVMIAFPGGLVGTAYAKAYHWLTVYNDHRIGYPSYQMHEIVSSAEYVCDVLHPSLIKFVHHMNCRAITWV